jgi:hypothetical protein
MKSVFLKVNPSLNCFLLYELNYSIISFNNSKLITYSSVTTFTSLHFNTCIIIWMYINFYIYNWLIKISIGFMIQLLIILNSLKILYSKHLKCLVNLEYHYFFLQINHFKAKINFYTFKALIFISLNKTAQSYRNILYYIFHNFT